MKAKHTPGPWNIEAGQRWITIIASGDVLIAEVDTHHEAAALDSLANVRLMAAAPDSHACNIELARIVRELCATYSHPLPATTLARSDAAIAKALGHDG